MKLSFICPQHGLGLTRADSELQCPHGHAYPVVHGIPVLHPTDEAVERALSQARSLNQADYEGPGVIPLVKANIVNTNGKLYRHLLEGVPRYPIPDLRLAPGGGRSFLDVGCGWGRWSAAAARKGYQVTSIDPNFRAAFAVRIVLHQLGLESTVVCGDARSMPFADRQFEQVFSYSVLQHFPKEDVRATLREVARVLAPGGKSLIQMANRNGVRSLQQRVAHRNDRRAGFGPVRYWAPCELMEAFSEEIGPTSLSVDGFFGLGIQPSDLDLMPLRFKAVIRASEFLRRTGALTRFADSVYLESTGVRPDAPHFAPKPADPSP